jgi:hypothetical protein
MSGSSSTPLSQAYGYGIVLGLGFAFAILMVRNVLAPYQTCSDDRC